MSLSRLTQVLLTPSLKGTRAKILIDSMSKDPSDLGVDLHVVQLCGEGTIETT
jgi:hypothetical protein